MSESLQEKKARLRSLLEKRPDAVSLPRVEPRRQRSDLEPLSFAQQGLWFVSQLEGPNPAYNNSFIIRLSGSLDLDALSRAASTMIRRHEPLRTRFVARGGVPSQLLSEVSEARLEPRWVTRTEAEAVYLSEARRPFDLGADRLFRAGLFRESGDRSVLVVSMHHIISDAWSVGVFLRELVSLYESYSGGRGVSLAPLPITYSDYVHWERAWLGSDVLEHQLAYWRGQLKDLPPLLALPTDHPRPVLQSSHGDTVELAAPPQLLDELRAVSRDQRCSLFVTLLAGLAVLLHRYSSQRDLAIGTGVANRRSPELEGLIGYFVNTLALRVEVSPEQPFTSVLKAAREVFLQALANQDVPYHRVVEELRPRRNAGYSPLFQVMLTLQNVAYERRVELPFLTIEAELPPSGSAKFDLSFAIQEEPDGLKGQIEYRSDIFEAATVRRLAEHYVLLLQQIASNPGQQVGRYGFLTPEEHRLLCVEWSGSGRIVTPGKSIQALFEERVRERPEAIALVHRDRSLTYGELNAKANQLARHLRVLGVGEETLVGICVERGFELVIALLAVLKAGGGYLPLDPENPAERMRYLLDDAAVELLLTSTAMCAAVPAEAARVALVDQLLATPELAGLPPHDLAAAGGETALAYVMYTSGSTGEPKGVAVEHRGVTRLVCGPDWIDLDAGTVTIQHSPVSFDASTFEIWAPLLNGGRLVLRHGEAADIEGLAEQVERHGVNTLWLSAGVLPLWVDLRGRRDLALRYLLVGGDVVSERLVREVYTRDPEVVVINGYGPTENTTFSCCFPVPRGEITAGSLPIGRPIQGTSAYVLDESLQMQPLGGVGELYVGGAGLARGYLGKPALTERRFVFHPFSPDPEDRLYRTGDNVRWLASGDLEFLGRVDNQVKIRGYRIELEEIELHLMQLPEVKLGAVVAREDAVLGKRLVAYVVAGDREGQGPGEADAGDRDPWISRCKAALRKKLPEYMVPSTFVLCETLPLTANGKVDRRSLPDPGEGDLHRTEHRPPRDETERALCAIWQEVLQLERVGVDDSFFDLGGHSLLATRLAAEIRERLHKRLPLDELFQNPSVAGVASYLAGERSAPAPEQLPVLGADEVSRYEPFPMTGVQQAYWLGRFGVFELGNISTHAYVEIELRDLDLHRLEGAWNRLIERHGMLRAVFAADGTQRILPAVSRYEVACDDLRGHTTEERERHLDRIRDRMSHQIFAVTEWPLFELRVTRLAARLFRLHFSMDGLLSDAMSSLILVRELDRLYEDPSAVLSALTISFRDYVLGLDQIRTTVLYERARDYWERRAPELPPAPELPLARDPGAITRPRFQRRFCILDAERWASLQEKARDAGVTPSVLLVSAFSRVLGRWSRSRRFTLNLTLFNRLPVHPQVEELVGDFTSLILLEVDGRVREPLADFARRIQERLWADMEHRYFDGIEVLRSLNRRSSGGKPVLMPVVFTSALGLAGREVERAAGPLARALSDLSAEGSFGITQTSQVWLDNVVSEAHDRLTITWDALEELFPAGALDAMFAAYRLLLEGLAMGALSPRDFCEPPLPELQAERRRAVNGTEAEIPECLLQDLFREQVRRRPHAPAVIQGDVTLEYADLDRCANAIARALEERGARCNELVAVVMVKGWEQIVGVLGTLYAGAAYLPIDAALPAERIALLLAQGEARIVLTQSDVAPRVSWPQGIEVITIGRGDVDRPSAGAPEPSPAKPEDLAYVIFTSGSTGVPKGVMIDHRGAVNTIVDVSRRLGLDEGDRVLGLSSLSFDLSVYDIFGVLGAGGVLVLPERSRERDTAHWVELVDRHGVTIWNTVPILAQLFVDELTRGGRAGAGLRLVLMSGDWIPLPLPSRLKACCPDALLVSLGGATEASIWSIFHVIDRVDEEWTSIPYGKPLANQRFHVLGQDLAPSPDWVPGDLCIAGVGLAKGYWRDEEKTRRSFLQHPGTGERLYRTGDLGRYWPDGTIEFLGREDTQVKVHGHRIELGEIEAALSQHERVAGAAVAVAGDGAERRIVAYVVPAVQLDGGGPGENPVLIGDPAQQAAFKLEQRGLRRFPPDTETIPLAASPREGGGEGLSLAVGMSLREARHLGGFSPGRRPIHRERWGRWLSCLAQVPVAGHPIPKRYYPSAGSLYPVQAYLDLKEGAVEGLAAGRYYYDPSSHGLVRLGSGPAGLPADAGFELFLVAAREAIEPLYGGLAERFCLLEAGHMIGLLAAAAPAHGIAFANIPAGDALREAMRLEEGHRLLAGCAGGPAEPAAPGETTTLHVLARQSYREFLADRIDIGKLTELLAAVPHQGMALYLYLKSGAAEDGAAGFHLFDPRERRLIRKAGPDEELMSAVHAHANRGIYARSAFSMYLVAGSNDDREALAAGCLGQILMSLAPQHGLGLCPIGNLASARLRERLELAPSDLLLYCFEGGAVDVDQTLRWPLEAAALAADEIEELRDFLRRRLPSYMIPSIFVPLERLPLSQNGKLDRKALPKVDAISLPASRYEAPRNEIERSIARKWADMLGVERVGIHDNFFELGGNSLLATRIVSVLWNEFPGDGGKLSLETFFENPMVSAVAELVSLGREARLLEENRARMTLDEQTIEEGEI